MSKVRLFPKMRIVIRRSRLLSSTRTVHTRLHSGLFCLWVGDRLLPLTFAVLTRLCLSLLGLWTGLRRHGLSIPSLKVHSLLVQDALDSVSLF